MILERALEIAERVRGEMGPFCERCEIAGSIRREKPEVKDIEICYIPRGKDLPKLAEVFNKWPAVKGRIGGRYTQRTHPAGITLDLFAATPDNWGLIFAIRTGSADYSKNVLATGWVRAGYKSVGGMLHRNGTPVPAPEERDLFRLIGVEWKPPSGRL